MNGVKRIRELFMISLEPISLDRISVKPSAFAGERACKWRVRGRVIMVRGLKNYS